MKTQNVLKPAALRARLLIAMGCIIMALTPASQAGLAIPYALDANTLHLWHFDEPGTDPSIYTNISNIINDPQTVVDVTTNPQTQPITLTMWPGPLNAWTASPNNVPTEFATNGQSAAFPNLGNSIVTAQSACYYAPRVLLIDNNTNDATYGQVNNSSFNPNPAYTNWSDVINTNTGAFTLEMLIRPNVNPLTETAQYQFLLDGDSGFSARAWQWRLTENGRMEFNLNINHGGNPHDVFGNLPATGPDAAAAGNWYHVAVTFTGTAPTNGDPARVLTMYWTLLDPTRTHCDVLTNFTLANGLGGFPTITIGGGGRSSPFSGTGTAGASGFLGSIDEVRMSDVCLKSNEMAFNNSIALLPVTIAGPSPTNVLIAYGQTLTLSPSEVGTGPIINQWYQNGVALPGQTNSALVISNMTFSANGNYQLLATNVYGGIFTNASSAVVTVTVGAAFENLFNTGLDANHNEADVTAGGTHDLHWFLTQNPDPNGAIPYAVIWSDPLQSGPGFTPNDPLSAWIGPENNVGSTAGTYTYQTQFQINGADPASATLSGNLFVSGPNPGDVVQAVLNGVETDITVTPPHPYQTSTAFTITNGLQAGSNTLQFTLIVSNPLNNSPVGFRVAMIGIGNALPPGLPVITNQPPATETVQYGANVSIPVVVLARPPLSYQWYSNGIAIDPVATPSAASADLTFVATNLTASEVVDGNVSANYQVVVSNDSGSVTSSVTALTIQIPPLTVASAGVPIWNPTNSETNIVVMFSKPVDSTSATNLANYSLDNGASVSSAALAAPNEIILATSVLNPLTSYTLAIQNVEDFLGVAMSPSPTSLPIGVYPSAIALWLRADTGVTTDANGVTQWNDLSGNGNNLSQDFGPPYEPQLVTNDINGEPAIRFNGTNVTFMSASSSPSLAITNDISIFAVVNFATLAGGTNGMIVSKTTANQPASYDCYVNSTAVRLGRGDGTTSIFVNSTNAPTVGAPHLLDIEMQGTSVTERLDGHVNGSGTLNTVMDDNGDGLYIGSRVDNGNHLTGDLAELIVVGSALSPSDVASLESYFAAGYGLHIGPVVNTNPTNIVTSLTGGQLTLSWPTDHIGWRLQTQTNALSVGLGTNWFDVANSISTNQIIIPVNPTNGSVFYRLIYP